MDSYFEIRVMIRVRRMIFVFDFQHVVVHDYCGFTFIINRVHDQARERDTTCWGGCC